MKTLVICAWAVFVGLPTLASAQTNSPAKTPVQTQTSAKLKGEKPAASPGWIVIEEDFLNPFSFSPLQSFEAAETHFRRGEEKQAAGQIDQAVCWLKLAENHAEPITKGKLTTAVADLTAVATDLRAGKITDAARMQSSLAKAAAALGEWHYFKAKESWGKNEEKDAGRELAAAAGFIQKAADSAHFEFGADTTKVVTEYFKNGKWDGETTTYDHDTLALHLESIEKGLKGLSRIMMTAGK